MILHVTAAKYAGAYRIALEFNDGSSGEADLGGSLTGAMFEPLKDKKEFRRFRLDLELGTIVWPNGADLAPEYLRLLAEQTSNTAGAAVKRSGKQAGTKAPSLFRTQKRIHAE